MAPHTFNCISTSSFYSNKLKRNKLNGGNSASLSVLNSNLNLNDKRSAFTTPPRKKKNSFQSYNDRHSPLIYNRRASPSFNRSPNRKNYFNDTFRHSSINSKKRKLYGNDGRHYSKEDYQMKKSRSFSEENYLGSRSNNSPNLLTSNKNDQSTSSDKEQQSQFNSDSLNRNPYNTGCFYNADFINFHNQDDRTTFRNKSVPIEEVRNEDKENTIENNFNDNNQHDSHLNFKINNYSQLSNSKVNYRSNDNLDYHPTRCYPRTHFDYTANNYSDLNRDYSPNNRMTSDDNNTYQTSVQSSNYSNHKTDSLYPVALRNLGNTCYMNATVQPLFNLPFLMCELRDAMERAKLINSDLNYSMTKSVVELFEEYKRMRRTQSTNDDELEKRLCAFKYNVGQHSIEFKSSGQHDAVEFLDSVINSIDEEFDKVKKLIPNCKNPIDKVFKIELGETSHCEACNQKSNIVKNKSHCLILSLPEQRTMEENVNWNLQQILKNYFKPEKRESKCEKCGNKERNRHLTVLRSPKVLILQLGRYSATGEKRHEAVKVPFEIILPKVHPKTSRPRSAEQTTSQKPLEHDNQFELSGIICHHGSCPAGGHYICYVHDRLNDEWYHCDDETIVQTSFERVQHETQTNGYLYFFVNRRFV